MPRVVLVLAFALLLPAVAAAAGPAADTSQEIVQIEQVTQQIRHLQQKHAVKSKIVSDAAFNKVVRDGLTRFNPDNIIDLNDREDVMLGFLKKSDNYRHIVFSGITGQVVGLYDYETGTLYIRNHNNAALGPDRYVIAHEYDHALQDQYYHLAKLFPDQNPLTYRNSDAVEAHHALTEGDSIKLQTLFIFKTYSQADIRALIQEQNQPSKAPTLPKALQRVFYFPYTTGVSFVEALYRVNGMKSIDAAYQRLPQTTYEIMHPAAYLRGWKPAKVALHGVQAPADWKQMDDDVWGALGYNLLLWQYLGAKKADSVTNAYRGDRYLFLENGSQNMMLLKSVWTSNAAAKAARDAYVAALRVRYAGKIKTPPTAGTTVTERDGAVWMSVIGSTLTMTYAPNATLAQQLGAAPTT